jgi:hypothetical protein
MHRIAEKDDRGGEMVNRRTVLKIGATTLTGTLVNVPVFGQHAASTRPSSAFQRAVFDDRFAECRAFATELESAGALTSAVRGDVAELWYKDLRVHLSKKRVPVAGLTDRPALFCLEELARDVGMRVIFRADHITEQNGHTQHAAVGLASLVAVARNLAPEPGFGREMAQLFSRFDGGSLSIGEPRDAAAQKRTGPFSPENKTALVSWVIA